MQYVYLAIFIAIVAAIIEYKEVIITGIVSIIVLYIIYKIYSSSAKKSKVLNDKIEELKQQMKSASFVESLDFNKLQNHFGGKLHVAIVQTQDVVTWASVMSRMIEEENYNAFKQIGNVIGFNRLDDRMKTPLEVAAFYKNDEIFDHVIDKLTNEDIGKLNGRELSLLHDAIKSNDLERVKKLVSKGFDIETYYIGKTPLSMALISNNIEIVEYLISQGADINSCLVDAVYSSKDAISLLLSKGANPNYTDKHLRTPLHYASLDNENKIMEILISAGADIEAKDNNGDTPLIYSLIKGYKDSVELLLSKGAKVEAKNNNGNTPFLYLAKRRKDNEDIEGKDDIEIFKMLISNNADIEAKNDHGETALSIALSSVTFKDAELVKLLIDNGIEIDINSQEEIKSITRLIYGTGYESIVDAAGDGNIDAVKMFVNFGANIEAATKTKNTSLHLASSSGYASVVEYLLDNNADVNAKNNIGETPLHLSIGKKHINIIKALLLKNTNLDIKNNLGYTPLILASSLGLLSIIEALLEKGCNINEIDELGNSALSHASSNNHLNIVKFLVSKSADTSVKNNKGFTPIILAVQNGNKDIVEFLLSSGIEIEYKDDSGNTLLAIASHYGHISIVKLLISQGANIEFKNNDELTPILIASNNNHKNIVEELIANDVSINNEDMNKITNALYSKSYNTIIDAAKDNNVDAIKLFLKYGANVNEQNDNGLTPLMASTDYNCLNAFEYLMSLNVDINIKDNKGLNALAHAAFNGAKNRIKVLLDVTNDNDKLFYQPINKIELSGSDKINLVIDDIEINQMGATLYYKTDYKEDFDWEHKTKAVEKTLGIRGIELLDDHSGQYLVKVYNNSNESELIRNLKINGVQPEFVRFIEEDYTTYLLFKDIKNASLDDWIAEELFIEKTLGLPVDIEHYDPSNKELWGKFGNEQLILIKESNISVMPDTLEIGGKYLKTEVQDGYKHYHFKDVEDKQKWLDNIEEIIKTLNMRVNIVEDSSRNNSTIVLKEAVESSIPRLLDLQDSHKNYPKLYTVKEDGENKTYYYTFLPEIDLAVWKEQSRKKNFRTLFNQPDKVYKLEVYDKTNTELYDEKFYDGQLIALHEYAKIPRKEELVNINIEGDLKDNQIFWGYGSGNRKYYTNLNDTTHTMIIGSSGSGKSNFMNGVILSLLHNIDEVGKIYLIDLKDNMLEFGMYNELNSPKVTVFGDDTTVSSLYKSLLELEAEMSLRNAYLAKNGKKKITEKPIYFIIDEFAQIADLDEFSHEDAKTKDLIFKTLVRLAKLARNTNMKIFVQSQEPKDIIESGISGQMQSRVLLKTQKETDMDLTLAQPDNVRDSGINHTAFDLGRLIFEDSSSGKGEFSELQFPYIDENKRLHMNYLEKSQSVDMSFDEELKAYVQDVRQKEKARHLLDTNVLKIDSEEFSDSQIISNENNESNIQEESENHYTDDFDFDAFLNDDLEEEKESNNSSSDDEFSEIKNMFEDSKSILEELKQQR